MDILRYIFIAFGVIVALFSAFLIIAAGFELANPKPLENATDPGVLWGLLVFFSLTEAGGTFLIIHNVRKLRQDNWETRERELLKIIAARDGRITPAEIAAVTDLTIAEAEQQLSKLCRHGSGELQLTPDGKTVYVFFGFLSEQEKTDTKSAMDF